MSAAKRSQGTLTLKRRLFDKNSVGVACGKQEKIDDRNNLRFQVSFSVLVTGLSPGPEVSNRVRALDDKKKIRSSWPKIDRNPLNNPLSMT